MDLGELYNSYKDNHAPRRDTQHPSTNKPNQYMRRIYAQSGQYTHRDQSPPNQYTRRTSPPNQYTRRMYAQSDQYTHRDQSPPNQYTRRTYTQGDQYTHHASHRRISTRGAHRMRQYTITSLMPLRRNRTNLPPPRTLIRVSDTHGRVLYSKCHGEYCLPLLPVVRGTEYGRLKEQQYCLLCIDEHAIEQRFAQFTKAVAVKPATRRRDSASLLFERFL